MNYQSSPPRLPQVRMKYWLGCAASVQIGGPYCSQICAAVARLLEEINIVLAMRADRARKINEKVALSEEKTED